MSPQPLQGLQGIQPLGQDSATTTPSASPAIVGGNVQANPVNAQEAREAFWTDEKKYLVDTVRRIQERGGTDQEVFNYLAHYEQLSSTMKRNLTRRTINPPEPTDAPGIVRGIAMNALQGVTFGFGDEALGSLAGLVTPGVTAQQGRDLYRAELDAFREAHGKTALAADIAGSIVGPGVAAAKVLGKVGGIGARLGRRITVAAGEGVVAGGLRGAGEAEGAPGERVGEATAGAVFGGIAAPLLIAGGTAAFNVGKPVIRGLSRTAAAAGQRVGIRIPGVFTAEEQAKRLVAKRLKEDLITPQELMRRIDEATAAGQPVSLADIAGPRTLSLLDDAMLTRDPAKQALVKDMLQGRQIEQGDRMVAFMMERLFRSAKVGLHNVDDAQHAIVGQRDAISRPLYRHAYEAVATVGNDLRALFTGRNSGLFRQAYEEALDEANLQARRGTAHGLEMPSLKQIMGGEKIPGSTVLTASGEQAVAPTVTKGLDDIPIRAIDLMKRKLDEIVAGGRSLPSGQVQTFSQGQQRNIDGILQQLLARADEQVPKYAQARKAFGGGVRSQRALEKGHQNFKGHTVESLERELAELGPADEIDELLEMYRLGAMKSIGEDIVESRGKAMNFAEQFFGGNVSRAENTAILKLRRLFPNAHDADEAIRAIHQEARMTQTFLQAGKRTLSQPMNERLAELTGAAMSSNMFSGGVSVGLTRMPTLFARSFGRGGALRKPWEHEVSDALSNLFLKGLTRPEELRGLAISLLGRVSRGLQRQTTARLAIGASLGQGGGVLAGRPR